MLCACHPAYSQSPAVNQHTFGPYPEAIPRMGFLRPNLDLIWLFTFSQDSPSPLLPTDSAEGGGWKASAGFGRWVVQDLPRSQHLVGIFVSSAHPNCS